ncbi:hypothetical protein C0995_014389, partial [Termitomyces sp. Mi166
QTQHTWLLADDTEIEAYNTKLKKACLNMMNAKANISTIIQQLHTVNSTTHSLQHQHLTAALEKANKLKDMAAGDELGIAVG